MTPDTNDLQIRSNINRAQYGIFLYTIYGIPFGPGAEPFERCFNMDLNSCQDGGPFLNLCFGRGGRDMLLRGVYVISRNSSEYIVLKKSSHVSAEKVGFPDEESENRFLEKRL